MTTALVPAAAAGVLLATELSSWLLLRRRFGRAVTGGGPTSWIAWAAIVATGAMVSSALVLIAASPHVHRTVAITAAGALAAVATTWRLSRSFRGER